MLTLALTLLINLTLQRTHHKPNPNPKLNQPLTITLIMGLTHHNPNPYPQAEPCK